MNHALSELYRLKSSQPPPVRLPGETFERYQGPF
jgi:hypothetical protein